MTGVLLALALGVSLVSITPEPPCPTLTGASLAARAIYFRLSPSDVPEWRRMVVDDYMAHATRPAPLVVESIAAVAFVATGRESVWTARVLSVIYWVTGGIFVIAAARRLTTPTGGLLAGLVFLFLPWALTQSRSFQPDAFAVLCLCGSLLAILRFDSDATTRRLIVAALATGLAVFVRFMTGFFLVPVFVALGMRRHGVVRVLARRETLAYIATAIAPTALYYLYGLATDPLLTRRAQAVLVPSLYLQPGFWASWGAMIGTTVTWPVFLGALATVWWTPRGAPRVALLAMWLGYVAYGLVFNFHIATHPYYQTLGVPMLALSLAPLGRPLDRASPMVRGLALAALMAALLFAAVRGSALSDPDHRGQIEEYRRIGGVTRHTLRAVMLTECWTMPLRYYGEVSGRYWPTQAEIDVYRPLGEHGIPDVDPARRLASLARDMGAADYFVITDLAEFDRQPALQRLLNERYRLLMKSARSAVYDLR